ncbi:MAG TPA: SAM-dependent methyltransferase [Chthoniobacterales bacterium]
MSESIELTHFIRETIRHEGPVTFRWFMEQALYHPEWGYYASGKAVVGKKGDFYTSVSVGGLFGELLTRQFHEIWQRMGCPDEFSLFEQGADRAQLAADVLGAAQRFYPDFFAALTYQIVEPSTQLRAEQAANLANWSGKVEWRERIEEFSGVAYSNELLDAMPVHVVSRCDDKWREDYVDESGDSFQFVPGPISSAELALALAKLPEGLPPDAYRTEINLAGPAWIREVARSMRRGCALVIDYGFLRDQYYSIERREGTLRCYRQHQRHDNPFSEIGRTDITAHVDFSACIDAGIENGLSLAGFTDQHHFLTGISEPEFAAIEAESQRGLSAETQRRLRTLQSLLHPGTMGMQFKYLALTKGIDFDEPLLGFSAARQITAH